MNIVICACDSHMIYFSCYSLACYGYGGLTYVCSGGIQLNFGFNMLYLLTGSFYIFAGRRVAYRKHRSTQSESIAPLTCMYSP